MSNGISVKVHKDFFEATWKLSMRGLTPSFAGFRYVVMGFYGGLGVVEGNQFREEVEQIYRKYGVDLIIDVVVNRRREIVVVCVGDVKDALLEGVDFARRI